MAKDITIYEIHEAVNRRVGGLVTAEHAARTWNKLSREERQEWLDSEPKTRARRGPSLAEQRGETQDKASKPKVENKGGEGKSTKTESKG